MTDSGLLRGLALVAGLGVLALLGRWAIAEPPPNSDSTAWGRDHVGEPVPEFMSGDECLFCHRKEIGFDWAQNRHGHTIRRVDPESPALAALGKDVASEIEYVMGRDIRQRFLKRGKDYGKLDLLAAQWIPAQEGRAGRVVNADPHHWDVEKFGKNCAGCHATGIDSKMHTFSVSSLDCFACHGEVPDAHTEKPALAHFSKKAKQSPLVVTSTCAQCHIRTGESKSTGLPYPNNFIAGDNLFRDFKVDLSEEAIKTLNPADAHILQNVRDVTLLGETDVTCLSCHAVHRPSGKMHHRVKESQLCLTCHKEGSKRDRIPYDVSSKRCEY